MSPDLLYSPVTFAAILFAVVGFLLLAGGIKAIGATGAMTWGMRLLIGLVVLLAGVATGTLAVGLQGYQAFNKEVVAARVAIQPTDRQSFKAIVHFPDGRSQKYQLAGDQIYIDAHIIKWQPLANLLGLHTAYELDRLGGRYALAEHEKTKERTIYALGQAKPINLLALRNQYAFLKPLIDAQYGSATFVPVTGPAEFEVRVSTTGLLMRKL